MLFRSHSLFATPLYPNELSIDVFEFCCDEALLRSAMRAGNVTFTGGLGMGTWFWGF